MARQQSPRNEKLRVVDGRQHPFSMLYHVVIDDYGAELKPHGLSTYWALVRRASNKDGTCYPSHQDIAAKIGCSVAQVKLSLKRLAELGLIRITMRRPRTSVYTILDVPEHRDNSYLVAIQEDEVNSYQVAINSQVVAINSQDVAIEQLPGSYELNVVELDPQNENHPTTPPTPKPADMTPSAPMSTDVEVVAQAVAIAQGEETTATDGSIASAGVTPFDAFYEAYPRHQGRRKAQAEWDRQQLNAILPTILAALSVTSKDALPKWPHVYLENKGWLDARPVSLSAQPSTECDEPETPRCCVCGYRVGLLSERRCDVCAREKIREEATELWNIVYHERPSNVQERLQRVLSQYHPTDPERFMKTINWEWNQTVDSLAEIIVDVQWQVMADARAAGNLPDAAENILAVVRAERQYGGLDLEKMIKDILERSHARADAIMAGLPWQAWLSCAESEIPTVAALVDVMHEAMSQPQPHDFWEPGREYKTGDLLPDGTMYSRVN